MENESSRTYSELEIQQLSSTMGKQQAYEDTQAQVENLFSEAGFDFDDEDMEAIMEGDIPEASFPVAMLGIALIKDTADGFINLTIVGAFVTTIMGAVSGMIFFLWQFNKTAVYERKAMPFERLAIRAAIEMVPFINALPVSTLFVVDAYRRDRDLRKVYIQASEMMKPFRD